MRRLEVSDAEIMRIVLQEEILRSEESRYDHRLHGVLLCCSGFSCYEVGEMLGHSPRTVEYWLRRFNRSGLSGLQDQFRPGRPGALNAGMREHLASDLRRNPRSLGYSQNLWDGKLLSHHIQKAFAVHVGVRQCQRLFRQLGFRRRKPRPVLAKSDRESSGHIKKLLA